MNSLECGPCQFRTIHLIFECYFGVPAAGSVRHLERILPILGNECFLRNCVENWGFSRRMQKLDEEKEKSGFYNKNLF